MENELHLPLIKAEPLPPMQRSMDEINVWIEENYALFFNREIYESEKKLYAVTIPFVLTDK